MIKRIRFVTKAAGLEPAAFPNRWLAAARSALGAPGGVRPDRLVLCPTRPDLLPDPPHDGVGIEWFTDCAHMERFDAWVDSRDGRPAAAALEGALAGPDHPFVLVDEVVARGADWLIGRWADGRDRLKHMALARRAAGLTPEAFSDRWRARAGTVGSSTGPALVIPERARGRAYVQNHSRPAPPPAGWPYDAVNEVYFDDEASLMERIGWFATHVTAGAETDLVQRASFIAVREMLVQPPG